MKKISSNKEMEWSRGKQIGIGIMVLVLAIFLALVLTFFTAKEQGIEMNIDSFFGTQQATIMSILIILYLCYLFYSVIYKTRE